VYLPKYRERQTGELRESRVYWINWAVNGRRYRECADTTDRAVALKLLRKRLGKVAEGRPVTPDAERTTFADLARMISDDYATNKLRSAKRLKGSLKHLTAYFADYRANQIDTGAIRRYIAERQKEGTANATVNRELSALKRAFRLAAQSNRVGSVPHVPMLREANARRGFFERDQFEAVLKHLPTHLQSPFRVAYLTGWRGPSEILTRQKRHIDLANGWLRLDPNETKNGEAREFPFDLLPELRTVLTEQVERNRAFEQATDQIVPWLFHRDGKPIRSIYDAWRLACEAAGVADRVPHDFRRTAVRNLIRAGVPEAVAMKLTGHLTASVFRRYAIVDVGMLREATVKLAAFHKAERETAAGSGARVASLDDVRAAKSN
jgi:integrase